MKIRASLAPVKRFQSGPTRVDNHRVSISVATVWGYQFSGGVVVGGGAPRCPVRAGLVDVKAFFKGQTQHKHLRR